jgi:hypothetical protein
MCCGQKRSALRAISSDGTVEEGFLKLLYYGHAPLQIRGPVTGQLYQFSSGSPVQAVDGRDAVSMLRTRLFRQVR